MARTRLVLWILTMALVATACANDEAPTATGPATGPTSSTTGPSGPTTTDSPSDSPTMSESPPAEAELEDGRHFGYVRSVDIEGLSIDFDLADFLTGEDANEAAEEHGDEVPPPNDYYIVNDNPKLRTLGLRPDLQLVLLDWNRCCDETFQGDLATFAEAINGGERVVVDDLVYESGSPFWITIEGGAVAQIEEQFLP